MRHCPVNFGTVISLSFQKSIELFMRIDVRLPF
jgi:hypothetical protein